LAAAVGLSAAAGAAAFHEVDTNDDGRLTLAEVQALAPEVTEREFKLYDGNDDDMLDEPEFTLWEQATGEDQPS
jgi:hypothetical protein